MTREEVSKHGERAGFDDAPPIPPRTAARNQIALWLAAYHKGQARRTTSIASVSHVMDGVIFLDPASMHRQRERAFAKQREIAAALAGPRK